MKKKKIIAVAALFITILTIVSIVFFGDSIQRLIFGRDKDEFLYSGTAEADEINITTEIPGRIKEVKIREGQKISTGELVAVIDSQENSIRAEQSEISLKSAQNDLGKVNEGNRAEDIKAQQSVVSQAEASVKQGESLLNQAQTSLNTAKTNYEYRLKLYQNAKALFEAGAESKSTLDNAQNALDNAKSAQDNAANSLDNAKAQIDGFKAQIGAARQKLNLLVNGATERSKSTAQYGVDIASKNYELSKLVLDKSKIISSIGGVIELVNYKQGEYVTPGSPIATVLDLQSMYVKVYVPEKVLPLISIDKEVSVKSDFLKDKTIKGKISYISPEAEFTPLNIVTKGDREKLVFGVKVKIMDSIELIKPGMLLDVNMENR